MTEGKLVRDLIPDLIRQEGRRAAVRHLSGDELVRPRCKASGGRHKNWRNRLGQIVVEVERRRLVAAHVAYR
jgi:hypothetical protein